MQERKECIFGCNDGPSPRTRTTEEVPAISDPSVSVEAKRALEYEHTETRYAGLEPTSIDDMSPPLPCISPGCDDAFWPRTRTTEDVPAMTDPSVSVEAARFMQEEVPAPTTTGSGIRVLPPCGPHGCFTDRVTFLTGTRRPVETGGVEVEAAAAAVMEEGPTRTREEEVVGPTTTDSGIHAVCDTLWCATHIPDRVTFLTRTRRPVETGGVDVEAVKVLEG
ncbi:hypothetical protein KVT40_003309 [Elsinoe batatas]|uniref:Uncharacterized protein n=1 Tax=Elsinoe batatas TaxID=2601811 RepID=A0A8K0PL13_9PEZI|nr:hypothetical protein KVT40_003309 [Elsinoe batatas]